MIGTDECIYTHIMTDDLDLRPCRECLCLASRHAARTITRAFDRSLRPTGMRSTQFTLLVMLMERGAVPIGKLADALGIERTTLTRNLALLESNGWIAIATASEDARARIATVTRRGRNAVAAALPLWGAAQYKALASIGAEGAQALRALAATPIK